MPDSASALFEKFVDASWNEHSRLNAATPLSKAARDTVLDALGACFAALILTGKSGVSRLPIPQISDQHLPLSEVARLPGAPSLGDFLGSRLFSPIEPDTFTYQHRRIGEYLGARWLARYADNRPKRKRLLALFKERGLVPANLRGLHAWLAQDQSFAIDVIAADPMGVIEYADADKLTIQEAKCLIVALEKLAEKNPWFRRWRDYRVGGIARRELLEQLRRILTSRSTPYALLSLVLESVVSSPVARELIDEFHELLYDDAVPFGARRSAAHALANVSADNDWPSIGEALRSRGDEDSTRLAVEILEIVGFENFTDVQIVEILFAHAGVSLCHLSRRSRNGLIGSFYSVCRDMPIDRIDRVLDVFADYSHELIEKHMDYETPAIVGVALDLIARRVSSGGVGADRLWRWLKPYDEDNHFHQSSQERLNAALARDDSLRQAVQRYVLLDSCSKSGVYQDNLKLERCSPSLAIKPRDAIALLDALDATDTQDERWRQIVELVRRNGEIGAEVRASAQRFVTHRVDLTHLLDDLAFPPQSHWPVDMERKGLNARVRREERWSEHRAQYSTVKDRLQAGEFQFVLHPALAYLGRFSDVDSKVPAHRRIAQWLGDELQQCAFDGFEAFLKSQPVNPTAEIMAESFAENRSWNAGDILIAALAERFRLGVGFNDLPDERVIAGRLQVGHSALLPDLAAALEASLRQRKGAWERYVRLLIEPRLRLRREPIFGPHQVMCDKEDANLADRIASEWLAAYPDMPRETESAMIERLVHSGAVGQLRTLRFGRELGEDADRRRNWNVVALLTDFDEAAASLKGVGEEDPKFVWTIRRMLGGRRGEDFSFSLSPQLLAWIFREFRVSWPLSAHPLGGVYGDQNPWDASDYLTAVLSRLGNDVSDAAIAELAVLRAGPPDGYEEILRVVTAEQEAKRAESDYRPPSISDITKVLTMGPPASVKDLQAVLKEELTEVQMRVKADDVDSWRPFFDDNGGPRREEYCRDYLITLLRQGCNGIELLPEAHVAGDKEVDIWCSSAGFRVPIEVKRQWHNDLWHAADTQLDRLYASDWRAARRGIYLVLWFGQTVPKNKPKNGSWVEVERRASLFHHLRLCQLGAKRGGGRNKLPLRKALKARERIARHFCWAVNCSAF